MAAAPNAREGSWLALDLWPDEYVAGWDSRAGRLFVPALATTPLGTHATVRITIRGTGIAATVNGTVVAARRAGTGTFAIAPGAVVPGVFLSLRPTGLRAARYLDRVARSQPVDFNERDPRYVVSWPVALRCGRSGLQARTLNVSQDGCQVTWPGRALAVGEALQVERRWLIGPTLEAHVCWASAAPGAVQTAGLQLRATGHAGRRWRSAVARLARAGVPVV